MSHRAALLFPQARANIFISERNGDNQKEAFEIFSHEGDLESFGDLSWVDLVEKREDLSDCETASCALVRVVPVVIDVLVSPSSVVTEFCDGLSLGSDWEDVIPQSFSFFKKRALCCTSNARRDEVRRLTRESAPDDEQKGDTAHTYAKFVHHLLSGAGKLRRGRQMMDCERTLIPRTKQLSEGSYSVKVEVEELEGLLGPEDVDVDFRRIMKEARDETGRKIFETFSSDNLRIFLVAEWS